MNYNITLNLTLDQKFTQAVLPLEENMSLIDFFLALHVLLNSLTENATTFDIYDLQFNRIALVGEDNEIYIDESYKDIKTIYDLLNANIDTIEVISLGKSSVSKVLEEETLLKHALDHYQLKKKSE